MLHKSNLRQPSVEVQPFWRTLGFFDFFESDENAVKAQN
jgi:hypothetical protein